MKKHLASLSELTRLYSLADEYRDWIIAGKLPVYMDSILSKDTGYPLYLPSNCSLDFNLGLGYTRFDYDSSGMTSRLCVYKDRDKFKNFFDLTQANINLVRTIDNKK